MPLTVAPAEAADEQLLEHPVPSKREAFKAALARRYSPRVHMSLILSACGLGSMLASWFLLHAGVHSMLVRYPIAISFAYAIFLVGVWTWLRCMGYFGRDGGGANARNAKGRGSGIDFNIPSGGGGGGSGGGSGIGIPKGGGGSFDGGGASSSWEGARMQGVAMNLQQGAAPVSPPTPVSAGSSSGGKGFDIGNIDGDGIVLLILAIALVLVVFLTSGYLIWNAPDVLTEAAFGAALTGTLSRPSAAHAAGGWVAGVVKKTWWPFALVMVAAMVFAGYAAANFPEAHTFKQAIAMAVSQ